MQCPICGFENMPGVDVCVRCRSQLVVTGPVSPQDLRPPRAGAFKSFRPVGYAMNRFVDSLPLGISVRLGRYFTLDLLNGEGFAAMLFSVVPGLGHFIDDRRRMGIIYFSSWVLSLALAANFRGSGLGNTLSWMVMTVHATAVFDAGRINEVCTTLRERLGIMTVVMVFLITGYSMIDRAVRHRVDFVRSTYAIEEWDVQPGDVFAVRLDPLAGVDASSGDLVALRNEERRQVRLPVGENVYVDLRIRGLVTGRVVALAHDTVEVSPETVSVNGVPMSPETLPDGITFPNDDLRFEVPAGQIMVIPDFEIPRAQQGAQQGVMRAVWSQLYLFSPSDIQGRVLGVYQPFRRRHWFSRDNVRESVQ